jgi:hypothetical protein
MSISFRKSLYDPLEAHRDGAGGVGEVTKEIAGWELRTASAR